MTINNIHDILRQLSSDRVLSHVEEIPEKGQVDIYVANISDRDLVSFTDYINIHKPAGLIFNVYKVVRDEIIGNEER